MALQKRYNFGRAGGLFNPKAVQKQLTGRTFKPEQQAAAKDWAAQVRHPEFRKAKETSVRGEFIQKVLVTILGYVPYRPGETFTVATEETLGNRPVDTALGTFSESERMVLAPFELKGPKTHDLDAIIPSRNKSPVQQAWEYAIDAPGAKWVLVSNCAEIRLYAFGHGREQYETWDLSLLGDSHEHERLWLLIGAQNLLSGRTAALLDESAHEQKDITDKLYVAYKNTRDTLIRTLQDQPPRLAWLAAIEHAQTILDRVLFIAFAQSTALLPDRLIQKAWDQKSPFRPNAAWENFVGLFEAVNEGNPALDIPAYNGGLFARNSNINALGLSNYVCENFAKIADYDFSSDVPVSVLGHIFEQSVSDIEQERAKAQGQPPPKTSKRKREGVIYTPDFVTRFIVEETVGKTLSERFAVLLEAHGVATSKTQEGMSYSWTAETEKRIWRAYRQELHGLAIIDPACGSGAFLIAAFDYLAAEYKRVAERLAVLGDRIDASEVDREILARNLHGVDLNPEPVEITKLSLWLKTAKRGKLLQDLDASIKCGNSLIADKNEHGRAFDWQAEFTEIFARGGFDVVLGNPPYVRMETIKPFKPYLEKHYAVASDRADLYAYFYEKGFALLRPGGRLGYISSSTFFRTGSGGPLRHYLRTRAEIENIVDFGDLQIFEGVTTYPTIVTMRRALSPNAEGQPGALRFLNVKLDVPKDLARAFAGADTMPRARLGDGSWQFEDDKLAALRAKIKSGRKTLGEVYGAPMAGIKTGRNEAFVISSEKRDLLVRSDRNAAKLLKPFAMGTSVYKWHLGGENKWLIYIARETIDISDFPSIYNHLIGHKASLESRALDQKWFELQQAQTGYQSAFEHSKIVFRDISSEPTFSMVSGQCYLDMTCFCIPTEDLSLLGLLNSNISWFFFRTLTPILRGGFIRLKRQFVGQLPIPNQNTRHWKELGLATEICQEAAIARELAQDTVLRRIPDLCPPDRKPKLTERLQGWWKLDFKSFRAEIKKAFKDDIPLKQRNQWESYLREEGAKVRLLTAEIEAAEREIDAIVYKLFGLTPDEIALLESSLAGQY